jgi:hypothetical protein
VIIMAGMGPPPKPDGQRRRRNATAATTRLPGEGRKGTAPRFPLGPDVETAARLQVARGNVARLEAEEEAGKPVSEFRIDAARQKVAVLEHVVAVQVKQERALWRDLWKMPQAVAWERDHSAREVAQYVRWKVLGENGNLDAAREARQLSDRLGTTSLALLRLRWEVATDEVAAARAARAAPAPVSAAAGARGRLRIADTAAAGA